MKKSKTFVRRKKIGRPVTVEDGILVTVRLSADLVRRIDAHATRNKADRSAAMRTLLEMGLKGE